MSLFLIFNKSESLQCWKSLREVTAVTSLGSCDFSYDIYPEKNYMPLAVPSHVRQFRTHTQHLVQQHRHTSHLTDDKQDKLLYSLLSTRRRTTVESTEARNGSWSMARTRRVGLFKRVASTAACSLRLSTSIP